MTLDPMDLATLAAIALGLVVVVMLFVTWTHDARLPGMRVAADLEALEATRDSLRQGNIDLERKHEEQRRIVQDGEREEARLGGLLEQVAIVKAELASLDERRGEIDALHREAASAAEKLGDEQAKLDGLSREEAALRLEVQEGRRLLTERGEHERARDAAREERTAADAMVAGLRAEAAGLQALVRRAAELDAQVEAGRERLARQTAEAEAAQLRLDGLDAQVETRIEARRIAAAEAVQAKAEAGRARDDLSVLRLEGEALSARVQTTEGAERAAAARVEALRREAESLERTADGRTGPDGTPAPDALADLRKEAPALARISRPAAPAQAETRALVAAESYIKACGLDYPARTLRQFHTALKVNESSQMTVLAGISGTGKSQLPRRYAEGMGLGFLPVPVQPRWNAPQDLMGFYNYIEKSYRATDLASVLWHMDRFRDDPDPVLPDRMMLVLLDEMNLARVEYYFSDFLSRLESRPSRAEVEQKERRTDALIDLAVPGEAVRLFPGYNVLFAGTMNEDESTQALSDKVVDRANVLRFGAPARLDARETTAPSEPPPLARKTWEGWVRSRSGLAPEDAASAATAIGTLAGHMRRAGRPIGHRLNAAMLDYVANYPLGEDQHRVPSAALADQIELRLLPKLRGVELEAPEAESALRDIAQIADETLGDKALAEAIIMSLEAAQTSGQFSWLGIERGGAA